MTTAKKEGIPGLLLLILVLGAIALVVLILIFIANCCVYFGFNFFVFTDNLFEITPFNPVVTWGIMGLFVGSIAGVTIATKKYNLTRKLIFYPVGIFLLLVIVLYLVNKPANHYSSINISGEKSNTEEAVSSTATIDYYVTTQSVNARTGPSKQYPVSFVIANAEEVELLNRNYRDSRHVEWMRVRYANQEGYVSTKFLRFSRTQ